MRRITALATVVTLVLSSQAALAGSFGFDLPRVEFPAPATTIVSTSGPVAPAADQPRN